MLPYKNALALHYQTMTFGLKQLAIKKGLARSETAEEWRRDDKFLTWISGTVATFLESISLSEQKGLLEIVRDHQDFSLHDHTTFRRRPTTFFLAVQARAHVGISFRGTPY